MKYACIVFTLLLSISTSARSDSDEYAVIRNVFVEQFKTHWQSGDAKALSHLWDEEGDWMSLLGSRGIYSGRDQIEQVWSIGLQGRNTAEARALEIQVDTVRTLGPDLAQVDLVMTFGHKSTGTIREAMFVIMRKGDSGWKVLTCRVARISATPAQSKAEEKSESGRSNLEPHPDTH